MTTIGTHIFETIRLNFIPSTRTNYSQDRGQTYYLFEGNRRAVFSGVILRDSAQCTGYIQTTTLDRLGVDYSFFPEELFTPTTRDIKLHAFRAEHLHLLVRLLENIENADVL